MVVTSSDGYFDNVGIAVLEGDLNYVYKKYGHSEDFVQRLQT